MPITEGGRYSGNVVAIAKRCLQIACVASSFLSGRFSLFWRRGVLKNGS